MKGERWRRIWENWGEARTEQKRGMKDTYEGEVNHWSSVYTHTKVTVQSVCIWCGVCGLETPHAWYVRYSLMTTYCCSALVIDWAQDVMDLQRTQAAKTPTRTHLDDTSATYETSLSNLHPVVSLASLQTLRCNMSSRWGHATLFRAWLFNNADRCPLLAALLSPKAFLCPVKLSGMAWLFHLYSQGWIYAGLRPRGGPKSAPPLKKCMTVVVSLAETESYLVVNLSSWTALLIQT